jgi:hypothetical protein
MTNDAFLRLLVSIDFSAKYWALCDRFPLVPGSSYSGTKQQVLAAFEASGVSPRYDSRDRSYEFELERIGGIQWSALFAKKRSGPELMFSGVGSEGYIGSNFAVLAYDARRLEDPGFFQNRFSGPAPYPRPSVSSDTELEALVREFVGMVREIEQAIRDRASTAQ